MRQFSYSKRWEKLLTPEIVNYLTLIHEYRGEQRLVLSRHADFLESMAEVARIQGVKSSNRLDGINIEDERLRRIVLNKTNPASGNEREIAGYRDALNKIQGNFRHIPIREAFILDLHQDLFRYGNSLNGGKFKAFDKNLEEFSYANGSARFCSVPAAETSKDIHKLCGAYGEIMEEGQADPLLIISMYIVDFLCIQPFAEGNGRMSRLLTTLLLYQNGYFIGRYISIEKLMERTKEDYYKALQRSSVNWPEGRNDYEPFVKYMLMVVSAAYQEFADQTNLMVEGRVSKPGRIEELIRNHSGTITKDEIRKYVNDISQTTIQRTLMELVKEEKIIKIGNGRYTKYTWNWEKEN